MLWASEVYDCPFEATLRVKTNAGATSFGITPLPSLSEPNAPTYATPPAWELYPAGVATAGKGPGAVGAEVPFARSAGRCAARRWARYAAGDGARALVRFRGRARARGAHSRCRRRRCTRACPCRQPASTWAPLRPSAGAGRGGRGGAVGAAGTPAGAQVKRRARGAAQWPGARRAANGKPPLRPNLGPLRNRRRPSAARTRGDVDVENGIVLGYEAPRVDDGLQLGLAPRVWAAVAVKGRRDGALAVAVPCGARGGVAWGEGRGRGQGECRVWVWTAVTRLLPLGLHSVPVVVWPGGRGRGRGPGPHRWGSGWWRGRGRRRPGRCVGGMGARGGGRPGATGAKGGAGRCRERAACGGRAPVKSK